MILIIQFSDSTKIEQYNLGSQTKSLFTEENPIRAVNMKVYTFEIIFNLTIELIKSKMKSKKQTYNGFRFEKKP